jgi:hypothetical protein
VKFGIAMGIVSREPLFVVQEEKGWEEKQVTLEEEQH